MPIDRPIKHVMQPKTVRYVDEYDTITSAIALLDKCNISALPVLKMGSTFSGVLSKSDIASTRLLDLLKSHKTLDTVFVKDLMNRTAPLTIFEDDTVQQAVNLMFKRHVHRLFVINSRHEICGVLSTADILRYLAVEQL